MKCSCRQRCWLVRRSRPAAHLVSCLVLRCRSRGWEQEVRRRQGQSKSTCFEPPTADHINLRWCVWAPTHDGASWHSVDARTLRKWKLVRTGWGWRHLMVWKGDRSSPFHTNPLAVRPRTAVLQAEAHDWPTCPTARWPHQSPHTLCLSPGSKGWRYSGKGSQGQW